MQQNETPTVNVYNGNIIINTPVTIYGKKSTLDSDEVLVYYIMKYVNVFSSGLI